MNPTAANPDPKRRRHGVDADRYRALAAKAGAASAIAGAITAVAHAAIEIVAALGR